MKLLVAEKPSVGRTYRELLEKVEGERFESRDGYLEGRSYCISWCVGHLVGLSQPEEYGWGDWTMESLPMVPKEWRLRVLPDTKKQFQVLAGLMKRAELIINGTDAGREGELIYGLVVRLAGCNSKQQERLWLNSFVFEDMAKAWKKRASAAKYLPIYESAWCRSRADWLVGMNGSRGYSLGTGVHGLSVGRVQTPTLALVVRRDREIEGWADRFYHMLFGTWKGLSFTYVRDGEKQFDEPGGLEKVAQACRGQAAELKLFDKQERKLFPGKPFDLAELQKAANRALGMKAARTLEVTQELYEQKLVTYPRTDSAYLPESMEEEAWGILAKVASGEEKAVLRGRGESFAFFNSKKVSDHYAIIPTGQRAEGLSGEAAKVYELIRSRFVMAFGRPYRFEEYSLALDCQGHEFRARATLELDPGFKTLERDEKGQEKARKVGDEAEDEDQGNRLTRPLELRVGERGPFSGLEVVKKKAKKPSHYTEATLLTAMETAGKVIEDEELREAMKERGLGTPATKAAIIEILKKREYLTASGKHLISTVKGRELVDLVHERISSPEMTGEWEWKLNRIAKGEYSGDAFMAEITAYLDELTPTYTGAKAEGFSEALLAAKRDCPKCRKAKLRENSHGVFCDDKEGCGFKIWAKVFEKKLTAKQINDLLDKGQTGVIKGFKGRTGKAFEAVLKLVDWEVKPDFQVEQSKWLACPKCTKALRSGPKGLYCGDREGCGFSIWREIAKRKLTEKEMEALIKDRRTTVLKGFISKIGKPFEAALVLDEEFRIKFVF